MKIKINLNYREKQSIKLIRGTQDLLNGKTSLIKQEN